MLYNFRTYKGSVDELRGSADIAMLLTKSSNVGGIAYVNSAAWPIGMSTKWGAESSYTFGHEVGHILGGDHDRAQLEHEGRSPPHSYGVGYLMPGTGKHTILA